MSVGPANFSFQNEISAAHFDRVSPCGHDVMAEMSWAAQVSVAEIYTKKTSLVSGSTDITVAYPLLSIWILLPTRLTSVSGKNISSLPLLAYENENSRLITVQAAEEIAHRDKVKAANIGQYYGRSGRQKPG